MDKTTNTVREAVSTNLDYPQEDEISLKEMISKLSEWGKFLLSKWTIILLGSVFGGALGLAYVFFDEPVYTAELTFVLEGGGQSNGIGNYAGLASQFGLDMGGNSGQGVFGGENFLALMKSRLMAEKALLTSVKVGEEKETLAEFYIDFNNLRKKWRKKKSPLSDVRIPSEADPSKFSRLQNTAISNIHQALLSENLFVDKRDKKSGIISLKVVSKDELFSKYFAEILAREVSAFYVETKTKKSADNVAILQHQTDSIRRQLNLSMIGAAASIDAYPNANPAMQVLQVPSKRRQGDVQVNQAILAQLVQNLEIAKMSLRTETPLIQIIDRPVFPLVKTSPDLFGAFIKWAILSGIFAIIYFIVKKVIADH